MFNRVAVIHGIIAERVGNVLDAGYPIDPRDPLGSSAAAAGDERPPPRPELRSPPVVRMSFRRQEKTSPRSEIAGRAPRTPSTSGRALFRTSSTIPQ